MKLNKAGLTATNNTEMAYFWNQNLIAPVSYELAINFDLFHFSTKIEKPILEFKSCSVTKWKFRKLKHFPSRPTSETVQFRLSQFYTSLVPAPLHFYYKISHLLSMGTCLVSILAEKLQLCRFLLLFSFFLLNMTSVAMQGDFIYYRVYI